MYDILKIHTSYNKRGDFVYGTYNTKQEAVEAFWQLRNKSNYYFILFNKIEGTLQFNKSRKNIFEKVSYIYGAEPILKTDFPAVKRFKELYLVRKNSFDRQFKSYLKNFKKI